MFYPLLFAFWKRMCKMSYQLFFQCVSPGMMPLVEMQDIGPDGTHGPHCQVTWCWWSSLWSFLVLPESVGYIGLGKILPKKKKKKTWMNFLANPILHWPTGSTRSYWERLGLWNREFFPGPVFDDTVPVGLPLHPGHWTWHAFCLLESQETLGLVCFFPRWVVRYWVAVFSSSSAVPWAVSFSF